MGFPTIAPPCASGKEAFREESNWPALMRDFSSALPSDGLSVSNYNASVTPPLFSAAAAAWGANEGEHAVQSGLTLHRGSITSLSKNGIPAVRLGFTMMLLVCAPKALCEFPSLGAQH